MIFIGIDPGRNGGIAVINGKDVYAYCEPFENLKKLINEGLEDCIVFLEKQWARPQDTPKTAFSVGYQFAQIEMLLQLRKIPYQLVPPQKWKLEFSLRGGKQESIDCAKALFPNVSLKRTVRCRKDSDGLAEALLIVEYGRRHYH